MHKRMALAAVWLLMPTLAWAQTPTDPEHVLPAKSQVYFRWDGSQAHRKEFEATAWGKTLKGDTGKFFAELWSYATDNIEQALDQNVAPQAAGIFKDATKALGNIVDSGVVLGIEVEKVNPPRANAVLVFPGAATDKGTVLSLIKQAAQAAGANIHEDMVGRRPVHRIEINEVPGGLHMGWWKEGSDAVFMVGTENPTEYVKSVDARKTGLAKHPLFQQVRGFKEFTTSTRGYLDVQGLTGVVEDLSPEAVKLIDALGVKGLKNMTIVSGYDGTGFRDVLDVDIPGPRKGLLALISNKKFSLKDLPPLPSDATSFSASSMEVGKSYDVLLNLIESGVRIFAPEHADNVQPGLRAIEQLLGVNLKDDIFGCFGDMTVSYSSPAEGPLSSTTLLKVKDGPKLARSIETLVKNIPPIPNVEIALKKKKYRDVEIMDLYLKVQQFDSRLASFAVYKDWFIYSPYPQGIKGFILRANGELPTYKAPAELTKVLAQFPAKEFVAIDVSNPRGTIEFLLSVTPFVVDLANKLTPFVPNLRPFDLDVIPHAQEATRGLLPSVTITTDNGTRIRSETRSSIGLP
jgi:hypothetical protein